MAKKQSALKGAALVGGVISYVKLDKISRLQKELIQKQKQQSKRQERHLELVEAKIQRTKNIEDEERRVTTIEKIGKNGWDIHSQVYNRLKKISIKRETPISSLALSIGKRIDCLGIAFLRPSIGMTKKHLGLVSNEDAELIWTYLSEEHGWSLEKAGDKGDLIFKLGMHLLFSKRDIHFDEFIREILESAVSLNAQWEKDNKESTDRSEQLLQEQQNNFVRTERVVYGISIPILILAFHEHQNVFQSESFWADLLKGFFLPISVWFVGSSSLSYAGIVALLTVYTATFYFSIKIQTFRTRRILATTLICSLASYCLNPFFSFSFAIGAWVSGLILAINTIEFVSD
ncbi:hypothetical protein WDW37_18780 [Bdellovibrionota bacterium FG-1]